MKIPDRLEPLVEQGIIERVIRPLMSGKEAQLFVVFADGEFYVAKVYKDAMHRSFRHRAGYAEGRRVRNSRQQRAMEKGSKFGKAQAEAAWQNTEVDALYKLAEAGVKVPKPHLFTDGVLLMELIVDADGAPAPRLFDVDLTEEEALEIHEILIRQIVWMLCAGLVHGDLSECNVLIAWDGPTIIDLPQVADAAHNPNARPLFVRDVENLTKYLAKFAPVLMETQFGPEIWALYERSQLHPDTPLTGRWRDSTKKADTRAILMEIETAARDAQAKREADGEAPRRKRPRRGGQGPAPVQITARPAPREERAPADRPAADRPRDDRPREARPPQDRPRDDRPREARPPQDRPRDDRPREARPPQDRPRNERPRDERPPRRDAPPPRPAPAADDFDLDALDLFLIESDS